MKPETYISQVAMLVNHGLMMLEMTSYIKVGTYMCDSSAADLLKTSDFVAQHLYHFYSCKYNTGTIGQVKKFALAPLGSTRQKWSAPPHDIMACQDSFCQRPPSAPAAVCTSLELARLLVQS